MKTNDVHGEELGSPHLRERGQPESCTLQPVLSGSWLVSGFDNQGGIVKASQVAFYKAPQGQALLSWLSYIRSPPCPHLPGQMGSGGKVSAERFQTLPLSYSCPVSLGCRCLFQAEPEKLVCAPELTLELTSFMFSRFRCPSQSENSEFLKICILK